MVLVVLKKVGVNVFVPMQRLGNVGKCKNIVCLRKSVQQLR